MPDIVLAPRAHKQECVWSLALRDTQASAGGWVIGAIAEGNCGYTGKRNLCSGVRNSLTGELMIRLNGEWSLFALFSSLPLKGLLKFLYSMKLLLDSDLATSPKQPARSLFIHSSLDFLKLLIHFRFYMALGN